MSEQATKAIKNAVIKAIRDSLRPVTIELTTVRTSMVAMKTSLDALCTTIDTQGVGSEHAARALQQLEGTVKGGFSDVIEIVEPSATRSKNKGKDANARVGGQTPLSSAASGDGIGKGGGNVEEREHALMSKREEAERINGALCAIRDTLKELCTNFMDEVESASEEGVPTFADKSLSRSSWAAELELTASFWPKSDAVHHEVRLIDGGDDGRAVLAFPVGDNPVSRLDGDMGAADDDAFDDMDGFESDT
eukprot:contig_28962_g7125